MYSANESNYLMFKRRTQFVSVRGGSYQFVSVRVGNIVAIASPHQLTYNSVVDGHVYVTANLKTKMNLYKIKLW